MEPNPGKNLEITVGSTRYLRIPIRTNVVHSGESLEKLLDTFARDQLNDGDQLAISEKIIAISQGRAFPIESISPSPLAKLLVRFVTKTPHGIGLGSPWTMQLAIREAGIYRILWAAFCSAITKPFGLRGVFYRVIGKNINAIDGPTANTLPPYNTYAKLPPKEPNRVALCLEKHTGHEVWIIDANDLGVNVLGKSKTETPDTLIAAIFHDNPLGQSREQTPICIVRKIGT